MESIKINGYFIYENTKSDIKIAIYGFKRWLKSVEEWISQLEDRSIKNLK